MSADGRRPIRLAYPASMTSGGAERQMLYLAEHLPRDRFAVEFIVLGDPTVQSEEATRLGVPVHVLGASRRGRRSVIPTAIAAARALARFSRLVRHRRYDIVDAWLYHPYVLAALTRPVTRVPVLLAGRRITSDTKAGFGPLDRLVDAYARRVADLTVANSEDVARDVIAREGIDPAKLRVIHNGVAIPPLATAEQIRAIREPWRLPSQATVIGVVANFRPEKRLGVLVEALASRPLPDGVVVVLVGDGPERPSVERAIRAAGLDPVVRWLGPVPDARPLMPGFDLVVSSSRSEGLSNSLLEAAAAGRPVVATRAGGSAEIVVDGESGILLEIDDVGALRAGIDALVTDPDRRARYGAAAREDVSRRFGIDRFVAETAALYESLVVRDRIRKLPPI